MRPLNGRFILLSGDTSWKCAGGIELAGLALISVTQQWGHPVLSVGGRICPKLFLPVSLLYALPRSLDLHLEWMKSETTSLVFGLQSF